MKGDIHIHSKFSVDSYSEPDIIGKVAMQKGMNFIAIADHNSFRVHKLDIITIPAEEVSSIEGHILALFIEKEVPKGLTQVETVEKIHEYGGIAIAAHPLRYVNGLRKEFKNIYDAIETKNGRCGLSCNQRARDMAARFGKGETAGSDAHLYSEIARVWMEVDGEGAEDVREAILNGKTKVFGNDLSIMNRLNLYKKLGSDYIRRGFKRI